MSRPRASNKHETRKPFRLRITWRKPETCVCRSQSGSTAVSGIRAPTCLSVITSICLCAATSERLGWNKRQKLMVWYGDAESSPWGPGQAGLRTAEDSGQLPNQSWGWLVREGRGLLVGYPCTPGGESAEAVPGVGEGGRSVDGKS